MSEKSYSDFLAESSLSRVYQHFNSDRPIGIMTAFRGSYSEEENTERNRELAKLVRQAGYGFVWVDGAWIENEGSADEEHVSEVSLMIVGRDGQEGLRENLVKWAQRYNQDAVVYKPGGQSGKVEIVGQNGEVLDELSNLGLDKIAGIYTRLRRGNHAGRTFVLESARERPGFGSALAERAMNKKDSGE